MILGSESQHHPRKYATNHGDSVIFVFTCCGEHREFTTKASRDKIANEHIAEYSASHKIKPMK